MAGNNTLEFTLDLLTQQFTSKLKQAVSEFRQGTGQMSAAAQTGASGVRSAFDNAAAGASNLKGTIAQLIAMIGGAMLFKKIGDEAIAFNSTLESSQIGLAAIARTFLDLSGSQDQYGRSMDIAKDIQKQLQIEGLKTVATYQELLVALQEGIGPAFKRGFDPKQVVEFTSLMTQAAAAISLPMDQLGQEIRSILDGTIDRNSRVAKALGITNEKVQELAASGKLFDYLKGKLSEFGVAGDAMAKTWKGATSNLLDAVQMALGIGFENAFKGATKLILNLRDALITVDEKAGTFKINEKIEAALNKAGAAVTTFLASLTKSDIDRYLTIIADTGSAVIGVFGTMFSALKSIADMMGGSISTIAKYTTEFLLIGGALRIFTGTIGSVIGSIGKLNTIFGLLPQGITLASGALTVAKTAVTSLGGALTIAGTALAAFAGGWTIGTMLRQFDVVEKAGIALAAGLTKGFLKIKEAWTWVTGGDTGAVKREIEEADRIYAQMFADVEKRAKEAGAVQVESQKKVTAAVKDTSEVLAKTMTADEAMAKLKVRSTATIKSEVEKLKEAYEALKNAGAPLDDIRRAEQKLNEETKKLNEEMNGAAEATQKTGKATSAVASSMKNDMQEGLKGAAEGFMQMGDAAQESANRQKGSISMATDEMKARYKSMADEVTNLLKSIADRQMALTADLADMARGGMSTADAWQDMKRQADDYYKSAKEAAEAGNMEESIMYADKAKEAYKQLNHEVKDGETVVVSAEEARKAAMEGTKAAGELAIDALSKRKTAVTDAGQEMDARSGNELSREMPDAAAALSGDASTVDENLKGMESSFGDVWKNGAQTADDSFSKIGQGLGGMGQQMDQLKGKFGNIFQIDEAARERRKKIREDEANGTSNDAPSSTPQFNWGLKDGGLLGWVIQRLAGGGGVRPMNALAGLHLPGYGGGDRRLILGEDGEVMLNKDAVKEGSPRAALAFNARRWDIVLEELTTRFGHRLGAIRRQTGGPINGIPQLMDIRIPQLPRITIPALAMAGGGTVRKVDRVHEIRWADGSVSGSQGSVESLLRQIKADGLLTG